MKKFLIALCACFVLFSLCACGEKENSSATDDGKETINKETTTKPADTSEKINIDLTLMSGTMVYSQVYDMVYNSEKYVGQIVKMRGRFSALYGKDTGLYYPALIIADATACCSQGIEFVLKDNPSYPDGYPSKDEEVTVVGRFETYKEGSSSFCHLVNARIL